MEPPFARAAILGVGLIGGSLGLALRSLKDKPYVVGIGRNPDRLELARRMGAVDGYSTSIADVSGCDLVVLAMPIENILSTLQELRVCVSPGSVVTDVGSTKRRICEKARECLPEGVEFIGGHPVAGRELAGVEHSLAGLFRGAPYVLCPAPGERSAGLVRLRKLTDLIGARTYVMSADEHDASLAWVSHLPQLLSTALAAGSAARPLTVSGSGFRDMTRLAGSTYSVWSGIIDTNLDFVDDALSEYIRRLECLRVRLKEGNLRAEFEAAAEVYRQTRQMP